MTFWDPWQNPARPCTSEGWRRAGVPETGDAKVIGQAILGHLKAKYLLQHLFPAMPAILER